MNRVSEWVSDRVPFECLRKSMAWLRHPWAKNENWNWYPFFSDAKTKYEVQNHFSKLGENEKQKPKFKSVFQCNAKTKNVNDIWIPFSHAIDKRLAPRYTHLNSNLFFNVMRKRKMEWHLNSLFLCHRKTVGTKVHAFKAWRDRRR